MSLVNKKALISYVIEGLLVFVLYRMQHFYANHLGFMRSILHRSRKFDLAYGHWVLPFACSLLFVIIIYLYRKKQKQALVIADYILLLEAFLYLALSQVFSYPHIPLYYVYLIGGFVIIAIQWLLAWKTKCEVR